MQEEDREEPEQGLARVLITGYQAPIRSSAEDMDKVTKFQGLEVRLGKEWGIPWENLEAGAFGVARLCEANKGVQGSRRPGFAFDIV